MCVDVQVNAARQCPRHLDRDVMAGTDSAQFQDIFVRNAQALGPFHGLAVGFPIGNAVLRTGPRTAVLRCDHHFFRVEQLVPAQVLVFVGIERTDVAAYLDYGIDAEFNIFTGFNFRYPDFFGNNFLDNSFPHNHPPSSFQALVRPSDQQKLACAIIFSLTEIIDIRCRIL